MQERTARVSIAKGYAHAARKVKSSDSCGYRMQINFTRGGISRRWLSLDCGSSTRRAASFSKETSVVEHPQRTHSIELSFFDTDGLAQLSQNEYLVMAGTLHGIHAITSRLSPVGNSSGAQVIEGESFKMTISLTPTGR